MRTTFGTQVSASSQVTRLLVILPASYLLSESTSLDDSAKASNCILDRFILPQFHLQHIGKPGVEILCSPLATGLVSECWQPCR